MSSTGERPIPWEALLDWYLGAGDLLANLEACCVVVRSLPTGDEASNTGAATLLHSLILEGELWLLTHPCPEEWNRANLFEALHAFTAIGMLVVTAGGDPVIVDHSALHEAIGAACRKVDDINALVARLLAARNL